MKRSSRFKIASIIVILIHSLLLTGCWDRVEVNDLALILAFAVDKEEDGLYRMSVQLPWSAVSEVLPAVVEGPVETRVIMWIRLPEKHSGKRTTFCSQG